MERITHLQLKEILQDTMNCFVTSRDLEAEDVSYALAFHYFKAIGYLLRDGVAYREGIEIAQVMKHSYHGSTFKMLVCWASEDEEDVPYVEEVIFSNLI